MGRELNCSVYNVEMLLISVFQSKTVDQAISQVTGRRTKPLKGFAKYTREELEDMEKLHEQGLTWEEVGQIWNLTAGCAFRAVKRYKERRNEDEQSNFDRTIN